MFTYLNHTAGNTMRVPIRDCSAGNISAADVFDTAGRKLLSSNTVINGYIRAHMMSNGIRSVCIYDAERSGLSTGKRISEGRIEALPQIRKLIINLLTDGKMSLDDLTGVADKLLNHKNVNKPDCIDRFIEQMKAVDQYTYSHCVNVAFYSMLTAVWLGLPEGDAGLSLLCGLLHDLGKIQIPRCILKKAGALSSSEYKCMKTHTTCGYHMLLHYHDIDARVKKAVLLHHERLDGTGYPFGVAPDSLFVRIVAIADVYDAITTDRVYKKKGTPFKAFEFFLNEGKPLFDWHVTRIFTENISAAITGTSVMLSSGQKAEIAYIPPDDPLSPVLLCGSQYKEAKISEITRLV